MGRQGWVCGAALVAACGAATPVPGVSSGGERRNAVNVSFSTSLISQCVRVRRPERVAALAFDGSRLPFDLGVGQEPGTRPRCRRDELRLLRLQSLSIDGRRTYVRRGGCRLPCDEPQATVHVRASALTGRVRLLPRSARNGNGDRVAGCRRTVRNAPQLVGAELRRMYYKTPAELRRRRNAGRSGGDGARWSNYGDPGARYRSAGRRATHYNYLLWNLPRTRAGILPGGGIVEAILPAETTIGLCRGQRISLAAFDRRGTRNGHVTFGYARIRSAAQGGYAIYGWVLLGYRYEQQAFKRTTTTS